MTTTRVDGVIEGNNHVTKRIDTAAGAAAQEIVTLQKVLGLQQKENIRLQEQVTQLEGELDDIRYIAEKRQKHLNHANDKISDRDNTIKTLEETLKAAKIEGKAFEKFSSQNKMLLESYLAEQKECERAQEELEKVSFHAKNLKLSVEERSKELTEKEIEYTTEIRHLKETTAKVSKEKLILEDTIKLQNFEIEELKKKLKLNNELRGEEVARSRQSEYKTLLRAEMTTLELQKARDEKEALMESINISAERTNVLDERLMKANNAAHENEEMLHRLVQKSEDNCNSWRLEERKLRKENDALMLKLNTIRQAMKNVTARNNSLEEKVASQIKYIKKLKAGRIMTDNSIRGRSSRLSKSTGHDKRLLIQSTDDESDTLSAGTGSMIHVGDSNMGLQQSSLLSGGDESSMISNDMIKSLDTLQYQGKRSLLAKHLRHVITLFNTMTVPESLKGNTFDLARCALTDDDMSQVIDWLRLMSIEGLTYIDMRSNLLTGKGCLYLAAYLLSLDSAQLLQREDTLEINCQYNMVTERDVPNIMAYFIRTPRPEIKYIDTECNGQILVVYGKDQRKRGGSAILRWNFEFNKKSNSSMSFS